MATLDFIYAQASPISAGPVSMFARPSRITRRSVGSATSHPQVVRAASAQLLAAGFRIFGATRQTINFGGPPELFEKSFRTTIVTKEMAMPRGATTTFLDSPDSGMLGLIATEDTPFSSLLEGVALEVPRYFFAEQAIPPTPDYWHLQVPAGVAAAANAAPLHYYGLTGRGVRVAMVDSGWYAHAYFRAQGYTVAPVILGAGASRPDDDESGHGTGESANILAIAPGCQLIPIKMNFVNTIAAFNAAVAVQPDIITCSWGSNSPFELSAADVVLASSVAAAVAQGITVIFAAGNGHAGFPGQHPDVISAGGVFLAPDGSWHASNYASAFSSRIYPQRQIPDVCGLVGMQPKAAYIMLPVQPGNNIDAGNAGGVFPDRDQTEPDDGWAAFSGTSAAAPQLAGVAALMKQVAPLLSPELMKLALTATARDVVDGFSSPVAPLHNGLPAAPGSDAATGAGLVDATAAVLTAYWMAITAYSAGGAHGG
jgi:subtilisin family serine protease